MKARRHTVLRSKRRDTRTVIRRVLMGVSATTLSIFLIGTVWYVTRMPSLTLSEFKVEGLETIPESDIEREIEATFNGSYFALIPKKFVYLYPKEALTAALYSTSRIKDVSLTREGTALHIDVTEHEPFGLWCKEEADASSTSPCFFIDTHGEAYEEAPDLLGSTLPRYVVSGHDPKEGETVLANDAFAKLLILAESCKKKFGLNVARFHVTKDNDVFFTLTSGGEIRIGPSDSAEKIFSNLGSILESEKYKSLKQGSFEYIDLRFGNKIFVEKEAPLDTNASSSEAREAQ